MLETLFFTCNAVLPIILLILLGYTIKRAGLLPESFFPQLNRLCFHVCLPVLLFYNIYNVADIKSIAENWRVAFFSLMAILASFFLGLLLVSLLVKEPNQKGVVLQCIFRSNYAIIGIPLATSLALGQAIPVATASVVSAISVPLFNILATIALSVFVKEGENTTSVATILKKIATNPLIIGVCSGIVALVFRSFLPNEGNGTPVFSIKVQMPFLYSAIKMVASIASPIALIALGGGFTFSAVKRLKKQILIGMVMRLVAIPLIFLAAAYYVGFRGNEFPSLVALFGTPVAVSSVPMSAEMKGDTELAGQLVVWTTVASSITLFLLIFVCTQMGLFA